MAQGNRTAANGSNTSGLQSSHSDQESKTDPIMLLLLEENTSIWNYNTPWSFLLCIKYIPHREKNRCVPSVCIYIVACVSGN